jgi:hypothetical protein
MAASRAPGKRDDDRTNGGGSEELRISGPRAWGGGGASDLTDRFLPFGEDDYADTDSLAKSGSPRQPSVSAADPGVDFGAVTGEVRGLSRPACLLAQHRLNEH